MTMTTQRKNQRGTYPHKLVDGRLCAARRSVSLIVRKGVFAASAVEERLSDRGS